MYTSPIFSEALAQNAPRRYRNPSLALLFSVLMPGGGHLYCGKRSTAAWTFGLFAAAVARSPS